jgi:hypothetical protein
MEDYVWSLYADYQRKLATRRWFAWGDEAALDHILDRHLAGTLPATRAEFEAELKKVAEVAERREKRHRASVRHRADRLQAESTERAIAGYHAKIRLDNLLDNLPEKEAQLLLDHASGFSYAELIPKYGHTREAVRNRVLRLRSRLRSEERLKTIGRSQMKGICEKSETFA